MEEEVKERVRFCMLTKREGVEEPNTEGEMGSVCKKKKKGDSTWQRKDEKKSIKEHPQARKIKLVLVKSSSYHSEPI